MIYNISKQEVVIMAKRLPFIGSGVALVTPFDGDKINFESLGQLIEMHIAENTDAIIICGTTGEAPALGDRDHLDILKYTVEKAAGRIPIIAGTGSNDTSHAIWFSKEAEEYGADGVLCVTPYYNKTTQKGLYEHYNAIARSISIPVILYNIPSRTGVNIAVETLKRLAETENIVAVKEASGNISYAARVAAEVPELYMYSGNDNMIVPLMSIGAKGVISVVANILPKETHELCESCLNGDYIKGRDMQLKMLELINALFIEVNPIPVKEAMNLMGMSAGDVRLPLVGMTPQNLERLKAAMRSYGIDV